MAGIRKELKKYGNRFIEKINYDDPRKPNCIYDSLKGNYVISFIDIHRDHSNVSTWSNVVKLRVEEYLIEQRELILNEMGL